MAEKWTFGVDNTAKVAGLHQWVNAERADRHLRDAAAALRIDAHVVNGTITAGDTGVELRPGADGSGRQNVHVYLRGVRVELDCRGNVRRHSAIRVLAQCLQRGERQVSRIITRMCGEGWTAANGKNGPIGRHDGICLPQSLGAYVNSYPYAVAQAHRDCGALGWSATNSGTVTP